MVRVNFNLRKFELTDKQNLVEILNRTSVTQYLSSKIPHPYTESDAEWWICTGSLSGYVYAIELNNQLIGCIGVNPGEFEYSRSGEIGYWLSPDYWGKGIVTRAVNQVVEKMFSETELNRIYACVFSGNQGSMKVLTKCGFKLEAVFEKAIYKDGKFFDNHVFSQLES